MLNALGILLGSLAGLIWREPLSARAQEQCKTALGVLTAFAGLQLLWLNLSGGVWPVLKQLFVALLAVVLGNLLGKGLRLQKISNRLGRFAASLLAAKPAKVAHGFIATAILFCAAPLGLVGAVTDGLARDVAGNYYLPYFLPLALKAVMDGLAMMSLVRVFRWPTALVALPVYVFLNALALGAQQWGLPLLAAPGLVASVHATAGLLICVMTLVIMGVRRVELANYLPALALAPLLTHLIQG